MTAHVTDEAQRLRVRRQGENRARRALAQLVSAVAILRTGLTAIMPLAGGAAWWATLLCLLPGVAAYAILALLMARRSVSCLQSLIGACLGRRASGAIAVLGGALLMLEAVTTLTALITLFTRGIGTSGTQLTLALLTGGALLMCLHREGLPRAVYLLRWGLAGASLLAGALCLRGLRADALFPLTGWGMPSLRAALTAGWGMGWPLLLLLAVPEDGPRARLSAVSPVLLAVLCGMLLLCLSAPHELLTRFTTLADCMLLPAYFASPAVRMLTRCLLMLAFFLAVAGSVQLAAEGIAAPLGGHRGRMAPGLLLLAAVATQALNAGALWQRLTAVQPWLLTPGAALAVLCLFAPARKRPLGGSRRRS